MFRVINEYMSKVHLRSDKEIYDRLNTYLSMCKDIIYMLWILRWGILRLNWRKSCLVTLTKIFPILILLYI